MSKSLDTIDGVIAFLKPKGITSFDLVSNVKRVITQYYKEQLKGQNISNKRLRKLVKVGHGGTLDKNAQGVIVLGIGKGTKMMQEYLKGDKVYIGVGVLGKQTDTLDPLGEVIDECPFDHVDKELLDNSLIRFRGEIDQIPPKFSAIKIKGKRASDIIREGKEVELKPRKVTIYDIKILGYDAPKFTLRASVSGGTYIRSLIRDIGKTVGSCAYMEDLTRTKQGIFTLEQALSLDKLSVRSLKEAISKYSLNL